MSAHFAAAAEPAARMPVRTSFPLPTNFNSRTVPAAALEAEHLRPASEPVSTGTTTFACVYDGGVVMAADTRVTTGAYVSHRSSRKLQQVSDRIFICRSGSAADTQKIGTMVKHYMGMHQRQLDDFPAVRSAAGLFQTLAYNNKNNVSAGFIVAGWDPLEGGQIYSVPIGGALIRTRLACGGSGSSYAQTWAQDAWRPGMSAAQTRELAVRYVSLAMEADTSSGGSIRLKTVTREGVEDAFVPGDQVRGAGLGQFSMKNEGVF